MIKVKTYAVNCNDAWLNTDGDDISDSYVKYADYMVLATKLDIAERACAAMAAENAGLKYKGREVLNEACNVYDKFNANVDSCCGDFMDGQTLHEFQFLLDVETHATDDFLAEIERKAILKFINSIEHIMRDKLSLYDTEEMLEAMRFFLEEQSGEQK